MNKLVWGKVNNIVSVKDAIKAAKEAEAKTAKKRVLIKRAKKQASARKAAAVALANYKMAIKAIDVVKALHVVNSNIGVEAFVAIADGHMIYAVANGTRVYNTPEFVGSVIDTKTSIGAATPKKISVVDKWLELADEKGLKLIQKIDQVERLRSNLMSKPASYYITHLLFTKDKVERSVMMQVSNLETDKLDIAPAYVPTSIGGTARLFERYTSEIVDITIEDAEALNHLRYKKGGTEENPEYGYTKLYHIEGNVKIVEDKEVLSPFFYEGLDGKLMDLFTAEEVDRNIVFDAEGNVHNHVWIYNDPVCGGVTSSASQTKKHDGSFPGYRGGEAGIKKVHERWNECTFGAVTMNLDDTDNHTDKDVAQLITRLSAYKAPSVYLKELECVCYFMGKEKLGKTLLNGKTREDESFDGRAIFSDEFIAEAFTEKLGGKYLIAPWAVNGVGIQCRPWLSKVMALTRKKGYIETMLKKRGGKFVVLFRDSITEEQQNEFNVSVKSKGKKGAYAKKLVIVVPSADWALSHGFGCVPGREYDITRLPNGFLQYFTDLNGLKATYDLKTESGVNMLDMTHEGHDVAHGSKASTQMLQTALIFNPKKTQEYLESLIRENIEKKVARVISKDGEGNWVIPEGRIPSALDFSSKKAVAEIFDEMFGETESVEETDDVEAEDNGAVNINVGQVLQNIDPTFVADIYRPMFKTAINTVLKGILSMLKKVNIPMKGWYNKLTTDPAADFGTKILGINNDGFVECLCSMAEKAGVNNFFAVKYPKMHIFEMIKIRLVTYHEYAERVDNCEDLTDLEKRLVKDAAKHFSKGLLVVPAIEILKNLLAGMDFDGDGAVAFADPTLLEIVDEGIKRLTAVYIDNEGQEPAKKLNNKFDFNVGFTALANFIENANLDVGKVTVLNGQFVEALIQLKAGNEKFAKHIFNNAFKGKKRTLQNYVSPLEIHKDVECDLVDVISVSEDDANAVITAAYEIDLSRENMIAVLTDLVACERRFQELTIDAAKTGDKVTIVYAEDLSKSSGLLSRRLDDKSFGMIVSWDHLKDKDVVKAPSFKMDDYDEEY